MNPATAMIINGVLTALPGIFAAWQASGGQFNTTGAVALGVSAISALNTLLHGFSTSQSGPLGK